MVRLKRLGVLALGVVVAVIMVLLGLWQANTVRTQGENATRERASQPAVDLPAAASGGQIAELYGRQVRVRGHYLPEHWMRVGTGDQVRVLSAFRTESGQIIAVVRGTVSAGQRPADPPQGLVVHSGLLLPSEKNPVRPGSGPSPWIEQVSIEKLAQRWPSPVLNGFLTLAEEESRAQGLPPAAVKLPEGEGSSRNAGYALQWWVFAAFALVMSAVWARSIKGPRPDR